MLHESQIDSLFTLPPAQVLEGCRQSRPDRTHERFCFELFRRAILEKSQDCWGLIYQQYKKLLYQWIIQVGKTTEQIGDETVEELALSAFAAFWRAFTPDKLRNANGIASILSYLKLCAGTATLHAQRKVSDEQAQVEWREESVTNHVADPIIQQADRNLEQKTEEALDAETLWRVVDECCQNEKERILARLSFVSDLLPRAIFELHPDHFASVEEIYTMRRNLKNRLLRNPQLKKLWGE